MAPVALLDPQPGEKVCDLCAAPGGKSTQIAGRMGAEGFLLCNEIHPARAKVLSRNIERLGVSKSHLVRTFTAAIGVPPGRYLTTVRIEAAQRLLLHREYTLDVVASLCGFSGANYLCRVFKKETGQSPAQWRALTGRAAQAGLTPEETMREQEMYI